MAPARKNGQTQRCLLRQTLMSGVRRREHLRKGEKDAVEDGAHADVVGEHVVEVH